MRRSDELISLIREYSKNLLNAMNKLLSEAERLKMRAYTRGFDYDYASFERLMDETLNLISSFIDVVQETVDVLIDESLPAQIKQGLEQMVEKLDSLFQVAHDAVKVSGIDREMAEIKFKELFSKLEELKNKSEEIANATGLLISLIEKRADEFDEV